MVGVLGILTEIDLDPLHPSGEMDLLWAEVIGDRGGRICADIGGLVGGEQHGHCGGDPAFPDLSAIHEDHHVSAFAQAPTVIVELDPDLMDRLADPATTGDRLSAGPRLASCLERLRAKGKS